MFEFIKFLEFARCLFDQEELAAKAAHIMQGILESLYLFYGTLSRDFSSVFLLSRLPIFAKVGDMLCLPILHHQHNRGLVLGRLWRFPISPLVRVTASARTAHPYIIGTSGKGKSKLLKYESTLELKDRGGKRATFKKREKVRYLQDNVIAYQDQAWGDGEILVNYRCTPGTPVDQHRSGHKTYILVSRREVKNRGDVDEFNVEWGIRQATLVEGNRQGFDTLASIRFATQPKSLLSPSRYSAQVATQPKSLLNPGAATTWEKAPRYFCQTAVGWSPGRHAGPGCTRTASL